MVHSMDNNIYLVRTEEYLHETEEASLLDTYYLPENVEMDYVNQFLNIRKVPKYNKTTGESKIIWKKIGQNDYRMAEVHAYICLDLPEIEGTLRINLEDPDFKMDMTVIDEIKKGQDIEEQNQSPQDFDNDDSYDIGTFTEGWDT